MNKIRTVLSYAIIYLCSSQQPYKLENEIKIHAGHKFAVQNVGIQYRTQMEFGKYGAEVSFTKPRESDLLERIYGTGNYKYFYRIWEVTSREANLIAENHLSPDLQLYFRLYDLKAGHLYFMRIYTVIRDSMRESISSLRFFNGTINANQFGGHIDVMKTYPYIRKFFVKLKGNNFPYFSTSYRTNLEFYSPVGVNNLDKIAKYYINVLKNDQPFAIFWVEWDKMGLIFDLPYEEKNEYMIEMVTIFRNYQVVATEYSERIYVVMGL